MADQVMEVLHTLNRDEGQTIVLVTHDETIGRRLPRLPRLVRMRDGRLVADSLRAVAVG